MSGPQPTFEDGWDFSLAQNDYSEFVTLMHKLELSVMPYVLQYDMPQYRTEGSDEVQLYVAKGVDGIIAEFPGIEFKLLTQLGKITLEPSEANRRRK